MNVIIVDDEKIVLAGESAIVRRVLPNDVVTPFRLAEEAISYADENRVDIAFLDINMKGCTGLELAKILKCKNPQVNIIFCTGYSEYALDAIKLYCSDYLLKPITEENVRAAVNQLRFPVKENINRISAHCFGNFRVFCDDEPIKFKYARTTELLALLIDRNGALLNNNEIMAVLFADDNNGSYTRNIKADLIKTFQQLGAEDVLYNQRGNIGIIRNKIDCDYFDYLDGKTELFRGEYMTQYSFAEETLAGLLT